MIQFLKNLISTITEPSNLYTNQYGDNWIPCNNPDIILLHDNEFTYQRVNKTRIGAWVVTNEYVGVNDKLVNVTDLVTIVGGVVQCD